jgi:hypothetical protein
LRRANVNQIVLFYNVPGRRKNDILSIGGD